MPQFLPDNTTLTITIPINFSYIIIFMIALAAIVTIVTETLLFI